MRINIFGGPCTGKSTLSAYIFAKLKEEGYTIELVTEFVKMWAYQKRLPQSLDQIYILAKQLHSEDSFLSRGVGAVITDSPVLLTAVYCKVYGGNDLLSEDLERMSKHLDRKYRTYNIFIERDIENYNTEGRYQSLEDAIKIDNSIKEILQRNYEEDQIFYLDRIENRDMAVDFVRNLFKVHHPIK